MTNVKQRLDKLIEYKERAKHLRGRHDQRDHTRLDYLAGGLIGDRGGAGGRGGGGLGTSIESDIALSTDNLMNRREQYINENRRGPLTSTTTTGRGSYVGKRPERQAGVGMTQRAVERVASIRQQAIEMAKEYWKRHRMTNPSVQNQGVIAPIAMAMKPAGSFFEIGGQNVSLFEDPSKIVGNDPADPSKKTNMLDYVQGEFDKKLDTYYEAMVAGGMPEDKAQEYTDAISDIFNSQYESYMRRAAASFALDLQGFVGGEIYAKNDPQFLATQTMLTSAAEDQNFNSLILLGYIADLQRDYPGASQALMNALGVSDIEGLNQKLTFDIAKPTDNWAIHNPSPMTKDIGYDDSALGKMLAKRDPKDPKKRPIEIAEFPSSISRLDRANPALRADIAERKESDQNKTLPLTRIWGMLHPKIQAQLARMMRDKVVYPRTEDASQVFEQNPTNSLNAANNDGMTAFKSILSSLHTDGGIADVEVKEAETRGARGTFTNTSGTSGPARKPIITLTTRPYGLPGDEETANVLATAAHEFGHLIDFTALPFGEIERSPVSLADVVGDQGGIPADAWQSKAPMAAPMLRIINRYLQGPLAASKQAIKNLPSNGFNDTSTKLAAADTLAYQMQPREIFARLYEQWFANETMRKIDAGENIPGVKNLVEFRKGLADRIATGVASGLTQRFLETADYEASVSDLMEIFNIMGWKMK
jgi:hypothetical protein